MAGYGMMGNHPAVIDGVKIENIMGVEPPLGTSMFLNPSQRVFAWASILEKCIEWYIPHAEIKKRY